MASGTKNILILQTGGTIDKMYPRKMGAYAFEIEEPAVARILRRVAPGFAFKIETICTKDSQEITNIDRAKLLQAIKKADQQRVLITHGTDTLCETARFLDDRGVGNNRDEDPTIANKTVVLTGALKPESLKETDADFNVGFALGILQSLSHPGVFVSIGCEMFDGRAVVRRDDGKFIQGK